MKRLLLILFLTLNLNITAYAKVPDCGDEKTIGLTRALILETLLGEEAKNLSDMFKVEISAVQTVAHSKDPEKYSCRANLKITTSGRMNELFGTTGDEVARILDRKMADDATNGVARYAALVSYLAEKKININVRFTLVPDADMNDPGNVVLRTIVEDANRKRNGNNQSRTDVLEIPLDKLQILSEYYAKSLSAYRRSNFDPREIPVVMLRVAANTNKLNDQKTIEFVSTTAQQDGERYHFVEIQKLWAQPDAFIIELAKFSKSYVPTAPSQAGQAAFPVPPMPIVEASDKPIQKFASEVNKPAVVQGDKKPKMPSFDCAKATSNAEKLICSNVDLAASDAELSRSYKAALVNYPEQAKTIRTEQIRWRKDIRDQCTDANCMLDAYRNRNSDLTK